MTLAGVPTLTDDGLALTDVHTGAAGGEIIVAAFPAGTVPVLLVPVAVKVEVPVVIAVV